VVFFHVTALGLNRFKSLLLKPDVITAGIMVLFREMCRSGEKPYFVIALPWGSWYKNYGKHYAYFTSDTLASVVFGGRHIITAPF